MNGEERTTALLGAGASYEARVPMSMGLTRAITDAVSSRRGRAGLSLGGTAQALNLAIGALVAHDTARGGSVYAGIDVERLFSAVQMLADRDNLEIAPFVSSWTPGLDGLGAEQHFPAFFKSEFRKELESRSDFRFDDLFKRAVRAASGTAPDPTSVFKRLEQEMISALRDCLKFEPEDTEYLDPLLTAFAHEGVSRIATLNYDTTVETSAARQGLALDTGIQHWKGGFGWRWRRSSDVRLLKLHGSINWIRRPRGRDFEAFPDPGYDLLDEDAGSYISPAMLGLVFGQRGKVRADGPFLSMLQEFAKFLKTTDRLLVVGYSFRDDHINEVIAHWIRTNPDPRLTVVDPTLGELHSWRGNTFLDDLIHVVRVPRALPGPGERRVANPWEVQDQHRMLAMGASEALAMLAAER